MASDVEIANSALQKLGAGRITAFDDGSEEGATIGEIYASKRDDLLRRHPWNFAIKRAAIPADTGTPVWGYDFAYTIPTDCLRLLRNKDDEFPDADDWQVESNKILTDVTGPLNIKYIRRVTVENEMDPSFIECLAFAIAADIALAMTASQTFADEMQSEFEKQFRQAKAMDGQEGKGLKQPAGSWLFSRRRGANRDWYY